MSQIEAFHIYTRVNLHAWRNASLKEKRSGV